MRFIALAFLLLTPSLAGAQWRVQDAYPERNKTENYLDRKERMFDQAERAYSVEQRERDLIARGILDPPKESHFIVKGRKFYSMSEYHQSEEYQQVLAEARQRTLQRESEADRKEYEEKRYFAFVRMWRKMGPSGRERFGRLSPFEKEARIDEQFMKDLADEYEREDAEDFFYEKYKAIRR